ncbi:MAG: EamA family transporter [Candidatus Dormibacteria bacterium]
MTRLRTPALVPAGAGAGNRLSVVVVAVAASLWASDVFFRTALIHHGLTSSRIVFGEDLLITCAFLPFLPRVLGCVRRAPRRSWVALAVIAAGPQAIATVLFTQSLNLAFKAGVPSETYLLQQLQPLIALTLAWLLLRERRRPLFWPLAGVGLVAVYMVIFAQDPARPWMDLRNGQLTAGLLALAAAALWATGTVLGRYALRDIPYRAVTSIRFALALPILLVIVLINDGPSGLAGYRLVDLPPLLGLAVLPGALALLLYYHALRATPASMATVAETAYPLVVTLLLALPAPYGFAQHVYMLQLVGSGLFILVIVGLNISKSRGLVTVRPAHPGGAVSDARAVWPRAT